jgi:DNA-directed RNA polymerase II subunit RPB2
MDVDECDHTRIAMTTAPADLGQTGVEYAELHPSTIFGVPASLIPFPERNQAPRNAYQSSQSKQAMGLLTPDELGNRYDTTMHALDTPQRPLVQTTAGRVLGMDQRPAGVNAVVAIMSYQGYNVEDALIVNRTAVELGAFSATTYKNMRETCTRIDATGQVEFFGKPAEPDGFRRLNYHALAEDGLPPLDAKVEAGDVVFGRMMPVRDRMTGVVSYRDTSVALRTHEGHCRVDARHIQDGGGGDGGSFARLRLRKHRLVDVGDKFSSRAGQKGVCSVLLDRADMPYCEVSGIVPTLIMSPHAIPSRMTAAQLLEGLLGKAAAVTGRRRDATAFEHPGLDVVDRIGVELEAAGYEATGEEVLYDPRTGRRMKARVFMSITHYQRLRHLAGEKTFSRACTGPIVKMTRQPAEGRARDGGLRIGTMEHCCLVAHGVASVAKEKLVDHSDAYRAHVCRGCGGFATTANVARGSDDDRCWCKACGNQTDFGEVRLPYACKLLFDELRAACIDVRLRV